MTKSAITAGGLGSESAVVTGAIAGRSIIRSGSASETFSLLDYHLSADADCRVFIESNDTQIVGPIHILSGTSTTSPGGRHPLATTTEGQNLNLSVSGSSATVGGVIVFNTNRS